MALQRLIKELTIFVDSHPTNADIQGRVDDILTLAHSATTVPHIFEGAFYVLERIVPPFEQLNYGDEVYRWLTRSYSSMADNHPNLLPRWWTLMLMHMRYATQRNQTDSNIDLMVEHLREHGGTQHEIDLLQMLKSTISTPHLLMLAKKYLSEPGPWATNETRLHICSMVSHTLLNRQEQALAMPYVKEGLTLARKMEDTLRTINHLCYIATLYQNSDDMQDVEAALGYLKEAEDLAIEINDFARVLHIQATRANCMFKQERYEEVIEDLRRIVPQFDTEGLHFGRSFYVLGLATFNAALQQQEVEGVAMQAKYSLRDAYGIMMFARDSLAALHADIDVINVNLGIINCKFMENDPHGAVSYYLKHLMPALAAKPEAITPLQQPYLDTIRERMAAMGFDF